MKSIWLIAKREFKTRTLARANIISSIVMIAAIVVGGLVANYFLNRDDGGADQVGVTASVEDLEPALSQAARIQGLDWEFVSIDEAAIAQEIEDGLLGVVTGEAASPEIVVDGYDDTLFNVVSVASSQYALAGQIAELGGDPEQVTQAVAAAEPTVTNLEEPRDFDGASFFAGIIVVSVLFFALIQGASVIMMGVVEEKVSRVVEILLATVKPSQLLAGKVLGVGMYSLVAMATLVIPLTAIGAYLGFFDEFQIPIGPLLINVLVWFLLGYAIFAILFGGMAALVSRQEDIGAVTTPMLFMMMIPFYLAMFLVPNNPDGLFTQVATFIPFFAPFIVPIRSGIGAIETWEVALAAGICLAVIPILVWLGARIYSNSVLNTGGRTKLLQALKGN